MQSGLQLLYTLGGQHLYRLHGRGCQVFHGSAVMQNFSCTTFVQDGSVLFTMGRRALHKSQHRLLYRKDIAHNSALGEHFQGSKKSNGLEQRGHT